MKTCILCNPQLFNNQVKAFAPQKIVANFSFNILFYRRDYEHFSLDEPLYPELEEIEADLAKYEQVGLVITVCES